MAVKRPVPEHPELPVKIQVPVMVLLLTAPFSVRTLLAPPGNAVEMIKPKEPVTWPL